MFGGRSAEYEVSLISAYNILSNIDRDKYDIHMLGVTRDGAWKYYSGNTEDIKNDKWQDAACPAMLVPDYGSKTLLICDGEMHSLHIDVVIPIMHGSYCEDGRLQGLFDICGLPYVGPGCLSSAVCMDKTVTKHILNNFDIPQAKHICLDAKTANESIDTCISEVESIFGYPVFVKPANAGSSVGTGKAFDRESLSHAIRSAAKIDCKIIVEEYIKAREIEVAVMGNDNIKVSRCGEIDPGSEYYDYDTKYKTDTSRAYIPARIPAEAEAQIRKYAETIYKTLDCRGLSRVDFFYTDTGRIVFNEINTLPGFTSISMYPKLFMNEGMRYGEIIDALIELALETAKEKY